jgi:hypothetical protein
MSTPIYCYLEQTGQGPGVFSDIKWAIRPLGAPLRGKPAWTDFGFPVTTLVNQITGLNNDLKEDLMGSMGAILRAKYLAQVRFEVEAPVYTEADLRKRASESKQLDYRAESSAPSVQQGGESGSSNTTKNTSDLEKRTSGTRQPDNRAGSLALPIKIEEDEGPAGVPTRSESLPPRPNSVPLASTVVPRITPDLPPVEMQDRLRRERVIVRWNKSPQAQDHGHTSTITEDCRRPQRMHREMSLDPPQAIGHLDRWVILKQCSTHLIKAFI